MTASLLELRRVPETCGRRAVVVQAAARLAGSAGLSGWAVPVLSGWAVPVLSGWVVAVKFTAVVTKPALILPYLAVAAGPAVVSQAIGISRRTS
jgi:hypothetical protein